MAGKLHPKRKHVSPVQRVSESPLARMKRTRALDVCEHTAADELIAAYQMSVGLPVSRDADLGLPVSEPRPDAADDAAARRSDLLTVYRQWRKDLDGTEARTATVEILLHESPLRHIESLHHWRNGTAFGYLLQGLRHFAALRGNTPRGARGWKYALGASGSVDSKVTC